MCRLQSTNIFYSEFCEAALINIYLIAHFIRINLLYLHYSGNFLIYYCCFHLIIKSISSKTKGKMFKELFSPPTGEQKELMAESATMTRRLYFFIFSYLLRIILLFSFLNTKHRKQTEVDLISIIKRKKSTMFNVMKRSVGKRYST